MEKPKNGEKGYEIVTPFYTHNDKNGKPQAIMVSRGWISDDMKSWKLDRTYQGVSQITGILY